MKTITGVTPSLFIGMATHYGLIGQRYSEPLRLLLRFEKEVTKVFQRRFSFNFVSPSGHRFLLYTDTEPTDRNDCGLVTGTEYHITFTVKAHIHDENKTARIERCTFRTL